jgi:hypothetical protein
MHMTLTYFTGFPYLLTRVAPSFYHLALLPADLGLDNLTAVARWQVGANRLDTCLVLGRRACVYFGPDGTESPDTSIPCGGVVCCERLHLCKRFPPSAELLSRQELLRAYVASMPTGYVLGDLTKGGHRADADELTELDGLQPDGVPVGLERCDTCGDWRGECLDPSPQFAGMVMTVCCGCGNDTLCARCGHPLADRRVNANYFDGSSIWHVPGFKAFTHKCSVFTIAAQDVYGSMISSRVVLSLEPEGKQYVLHVKGDEGYEDEVGPVDAAGLIDELNARGYRVRQFAQGLRRYDEPQLGRLAQQIERSRYA